MLERRKKTVKCREIGGWDARKEEVKVEKEDKYRGR